MGKPLHNPPLHATRDKVIAYDAAVRDEVHIVRKCMLEHMSRYVYVGVVTTFFNVTGLRDGQVSLDHEEKYVFQGGNDYDIFVSPRTIGYSVSGPYDTRKQVTELLETM